MEAALQAEQDFGKNAGRDHVYVRGERAGSEDEGLSREKLTGIKAALLWRIGRPDVAAKVWKQRHEDGQNENPWRQLARQWAWSLMDRGLRAHMRGDDRLARVSFEALVPLQKYIENQAAVHGEKTPPHLDFLPQLPELVADARRREALAPWTPVVPPGLPIVKMENLPMDRATIMALIRDLELIKLPVETSKGGVSFMFDPTVNALIKEGDAAVEPLIDCLENDTRLTRTTDRAIWGPLNGMVLGVVDPASCALATILKKSFPVDEDSHCRYAASIGYLTDHSMETRKRLAAAYREYWLKGKGLSVTERWYQTLNDDSRTPQEWLQALENIVDPVNRDRTYSASGFGGGWMMMPVTSGTDNVAMKGEPLRAKNSPSVSELMLRRMRSLAAKPDNTSDSPGFNEPCPLAQAARFGLALADWDGKAHLKELRDFTEELQRRLAAMPGYRRELGQVLLGLYVKRLPFGEERDFADYAQWITHLSRKEAKELGWAGMSPLTPPLFEPFWKYPQNPILQHAAETLFAKPPGPWAPLIQPVPKDSQINGWLSDLFTSRLITNPSFCVELLRGLSDTSVAGTVESDAPDGFRFSVENGWGRWQRQAKGDPRIEPALLPSKGETRDFRICDLYAYELSANQDFPACELYWPLQKRDAAIAKCAAKLREMK